MIALTEYEHDRITDDLRVLTRLLDVLKKHYPGAEPGITTLADHAKGSLDMLLAPRAFNKECINVD